MAWRVLKPTTQPSDYMLSRELHIQKTKSIHRGEKEHSKSKYFSWTLHPSDTGATVLLYLREVEIFSLAKSFWNPNFQLLTKL